MKLLKSYFSGNDEKCCSVVVITIMFLCGDAKAYFSTYETTTMTFKLKMDQTMTTYFGQYNFEP